jgi:hypothetical protein
MREIMCLDFVEVGAATKIGASDKSGNTGVENIPVDVVSQDGGATQVALDAA